MLELQAHRCAYCERRTGADRDDGHIEHFRKQADHQEYTLDWVNLYWSCKDEKTCGKFKDKCTKQAGRLARFDPADLIDPGAVDPQGYFIFVVDGTVQIREGLSADDRRRAQETLRVFQIADSPYLRLSRADAVRPYLRAIASLLPVGRDIVVSYVQSAMNETEHVPFATPIQQYLEGFLP